MSEELAPIETTVVEVSKKDKVVDAIKRNVTAENIQKYILGTKKNGTPRAVYDIVKDYTRPGKKKKKKHKKKNKVQASSMYDIYVGVGKKKKKKKKSKHAHYPF